MHEPKAWLSVVASVVGIATGNFFAPKHEVLAAKPQARAARVNVLRQIAAKRAETWRWQRVMGRRLTSSTDSARHVEGLGYRQWVLELWTRRALQAHRQALRPPHLHDWLCIHGYEGGWKAQTGNGYYGGLQMDLEFQRTYGPALLRTKGTADHWTPLEQIWVAVRAYRSGRGFYPWPNTARYCGLI